MSAFSNFVHLLCTACDSSCTGLNQCYGPMANQCCSYNDGGNCTDDCGMNREGNSTFHCVCSNFWTGANCDGMSASHCMSLPTYTYTHTHTHVLTHTCICKTGLHQICWCSKKIKARL